MVIIMDLLKKRWFKLGKLSVKYYKGSMTVENTAPSHAFLVYPKLFRCGAEKEITLRLEGKLIDGTGCELKILNRHRQILGSCGLNGFFVRQFTWLKYYILALLIPGNSKIEITSAQYYSVRKTDLLTDSYLSGDVLVVAPGYPSLEDKYNMGFIHTRVQAYQALGWKVNVATINDDVPMGCYTFEGVDIVRGDFYFLRELLQLRHFQRVMIHFFDDRFANVLESVDMTNTKLYFYLHGAETLYRDWPKIASPYFGPPAEITGDMERQFRKKDFFIHKYNEISNAKWVFVTEFTRSRCQELLNIQFKNSTVIPCLIDTDLFSYEKKNPELRKKIFILRKFYNVNSYSLDTDVRVILELSHRPFFDDLEFDIYGDGWLHEEIVRPLLQFRNVHIHKKFLTHDEIRKVHQSHGIALFATRFDSQAVSSCEAASSGCAVVTSDIPGIRQFIPAELGVMCQTEQYREYADVIEKMYYNPAYFLDVACAESESVRSKFDYTHTIQKEVEMFAAESSEPYFHFAPLAPQPILSIIVPSYNVEKYLRSTVISMLDQKNAGKIEILIINDGSKDRTAEIASELQKLTEVDGSSIVRLIDKENGGHGSTINVGIRQARGKYVKVVDGDDTVDSEEFEKLIDILERENSDVVLNNYIEDFAVTNRTNTMKIYSQLKPGIQYRFEDVCYPNYGFSTWGPILSCSSYKTSMLRNADFSLLEKTFYVDMELNINVAICCDTITYYDLDIYRYLLGRAGQSVNASSYRRNFRHHENVCIRMIEIYQQNKEKLPQSKNDYIVNHLLLPMISTQYEIAINYRKERSAFLSFDKRLKQYPSLYNNRKIRIKKVRFHRATRGILVPLNGLFVKLNRRR